MSSVGGMGTGSPAGTADAAPDGPVEQAVGTPRRFPCFDGLRAIAVTSVLLLHTAWISGFTERNSLGVYTSRLEIGVSIFFLVSGFLLYRPFVVSHLTGEGSPNTRRFWQRRLLRIVPAYWLALTLLAYVFHLVTMGPGWQGVVCQYLFLQIYFPTQIFFGITQAWSLCTEMSFYLTLPLYAWVVRRVGRARRSAQAQLVRELIGVGVLFVISFVFRYWVLHRPLITVSHGKFVAICAPNCATHATFATLMVDWLPAYLDLFALGMLLAILSVWFAEHRSEPRWLQHRLMPWVSWLLAVVSFWAVSHIVTDRRHPVFRQAPCEPRAADPLRHLRVPDHRTGRVRSPGPVAHPAPAPVMAGRQCGCDLLRHLSLAPQPDFPVPRLDRMAAETGALLAARPRRLRPVGRRGLGQLLRPRATDPPDQAPDQLVGSQRPPRASAARSTRRGHSGAGQCHRCGRHLLNTAACSAGRPDRSSDRSRGGQEPGAAPVPRLPDRLDSRSHHTSRFL